MLINKTMPDPLKYNDSAFLYVIFTFQALVVLAMIPYLIRDILDLEKRQHRKFNLFVRLVIVGFFTKWMWDTYGIV